MPMPKELKNLKVTLRKINLNAQTSLERSIRIKNGNSKGLLKY